MDMTPVVSATIKQIGYDGPAGEVHVLIKSGLRYIYSDVPPDVWEQFRDAPSKGRFLHDEFKLKRYACREIRQTPP